MNRDPLVHAFERRARESPDAPLLLGATATWSAGRVAELARRMAPILTHGGDLDGRPVGLVAPNGPGFLAAFLALRGAGAAVVLVDARTPAAERRRIAAGLGLRHILECPRPWSDSPDEFRLIRHSPHDSEDPRVCDAAVVKLTSGTSGRVRGILTSGEALIADGDALLASMGIRHDDRLLATVPFSHSYGLSSLVVPALAHGLELVVPEAGGPLSPLDAARRGATVFPTVPAYLDGLVRLAEPPPLTSTLRLVISAGAPLSPRTASGFREVYGLPVHVFYGASECGGIAYDRRGDAAERGTVGTPVEGVDVGLDARGRVVVRSAALAHGYWPEADDRLDRSRFVSDDLARFEHGELRLSGRVGAVINVRGSKVHPAEVERVLLDMDEVEDCAVLGVADVAGGPASRLRAVIACRPGTLSPERVVAWCRDRLATHKVPRSVALVDRIPRNDRGKVDHAALAALDR